MNDVLPHKLDAVAASTRTNALIHAGVAVPGSRAGSRAGSFADGVSARGLFVVTCSVPGVSNL